MTFYLQQKYLSKFDRPGEYVFHHDHGSLWGKVFLYFRANRIQEAINLLQNIHEQQFIAHIQDTYNCIQQKIPKKVRIDGMLMKGVNDVFR